MSFLAVYGSDDRLTDTAVYGPFVTEDDAREFAKTLSTDPEGDVEILPLLNTPEVRWLKVHNQGHPHIRHSVNPSCVYCQRRP